VFLGICVLTEETHTSVIQDSLKDGITYILRHLTPESRFCLYVNLAAVRDGFDRSKQQCVEGRTGSELGSVWKAEQEVSWEVCGRQNSVCVCLCVCVWTHSQVHGCMHLCVFVWWLTLHKCDCYIAEFELYSFKTFIHD